MNTAIIFCIVVSQSFLAFGSPRFDQKANGQSGTTPVARADVKRVWRAATYRGLTMGRSNEAEMFRILGSPKSSETFNSGTSSAEVWYHFEGSWEFPGTLRVVVDKSTNTVREVDIQPEASNGEEVIKHFGQDYVVTRYDFDSCLGDEESAPLFESRNGSIIFIEYRQRGIAVAVNGQGKVNEIRYVSEPIGAESSKCK